MELSMDVTAYCHWRIDRDYVSFFDEELTCLVTELADLGFGDRSTSSQLCDGSDQSV